MIELGPELARADAMLDMKRYDQASGLLSRLVAAQPERNGNAYLKRNIIRKILTRLQGHLRPEVPLSPTDQERGKHARNLPMKKFKTR